MQTAMGTAYFFCCRNSNIAQNFRIVTPNWGCQNIHFLIDALHWHRACENVASFEIVCGIFRAWNTAKQNGICLKEVAPENNHHHPFVRSKEREILTFFIASPERSPDQLGGDNKIIFCVIGCHRNAQQ